jgi:hypothetical protein
VHHDPTQPATPTTAEGSGMVACGWCGRPRPVARTGRPPKWCSTACRRAAWTAARAIAAGRLIDPADAPGQALQPEPEVVTHEVVREVVKEVVRPPGGGQWAGLLWDLAAHADTGRLYQRDVPDVLAALDAAYRAVARTGPGRRR